MKSYIDDLPLKISLGFLILTEILFWIGPIEYHVHNKALLFFYMIIVNLALYLGYKKGTQSFKPSKFRLGISVIRVVIIIGLVAVFANLSYMWSQKGIAVSLGSFFDALTKPGDAYHGESMINSTKSTTFVTLTSPFLWAAIPLGIRYWNTFGKFFKGMTILIILIDIVAWLGIGTRKGIFDVLIVIIFSMIAVRKDFFSKSNSIKKLTPYIFTFVVLFLFYFIYSNLSRSGLDLSEMQAEVLSFDPRSGYDTMPYWLYFSLASVTSYLCQGYYALGLSLEMGILPLASGGSSWFTIMLANRFGSDPTPYTYMAKLEAYGIDMKINWHSAYVWLANDLSFIGVPIFIFIVGYLFARFWKESLYGGNDIAFICMPLFAMMVLYLYANNQVFSFSFIPFFFWFILYYITRARY